jgi:hypothetical protein
MREEHTTCADVLCCCLAASYDSGVRHHTCLRFFSGGEKGEQRVVRLVSLQLFQVAMPVLLLL